MSKVPCGGFKLDNNFLSMNENDELSLTGGGGEGKAYQYLVTDGTGTAQWEDRLAYDDSKLVIDAGHGMQLVKVADEVPSWASVNVPIKYWLSNGNNGTISPEEYFDLSNGSFIAREFVFFIATDNFEVSYSEITIVFQEKGVYFAYISDNFYTTGIASAISDTPEIIWDGYVGTIKTIDSKYIKDMYYDNKTVLAKQTKITNAGRESIINPSLLVNGKLVTVNIDGTEYNATLEEGGEYMLGTGASNCYYHIGNSGGINISSKTTFTSGYPFFVVIDEDGACMVLFDGESVGTEHTFGVYTGEIKQIDPKYIPNPNVIVNITHNKDDGTLTADKTFNEVKALIDSGAEVKCMYNSIIFNWFGFSDEEMSSMVFEVDSFAKEIALVIVFAPDSISVNFITLEKKLLPEVSASDNNKFLSVVNGTWQASSDLIVPSSTSGSTKKFKITVDDSGAITATEVTT